MTADPHLPDARPYLTVEDVHVRFPVRSGTLKRTIGWVNAVDGVTLAVARGTTLGLVGESGSGKTTLGRAIVRIAPVSSGRIWLDGDDLLALSGERLRTARRRFQMIFQDASTSLDPRQTVRSAIAEVLAAHGLDDRSDERIAHLLDTVGLSVRHAARFPHELSGGQRQRVVIARALAVEPELVVCDEPVSALDVSVQAQVVNLLKRLQATFGLTYVFIGHDLAVVRHMADVIAVMYLGHVVEQAPAEDLYRRPQHPYTVALLSAAPIPDVRAERSRERIVLGGEIPSPSKPPPGCSFHTRCWLRARLGEPEICSTVAPALDAIADGSEHAVACHFSGSAVPQAIDGGPLASEGAEHVVG
jgi:peptide/nickel transport system ATP-binding protein